MFSDFTFLSIEQCMHAKQIRQPLTADGKMFPTPKFKSEFTHSLAHGGYPEHDLMGR